jgi:hypothetical protein
MNFDFSPRHDLAALRAKLRQFATATAGYFDGIIFGRVNGEW